MERRRRPKRVSRTWSGSNWPLASRSSVMVRNLYMRKGSPFLPGRVWMNSTGRPRLIETSRASKRHTGKRTGKASRTSKVSKRRFTKKYPKEKLTSQGPSGNSGHRQTIWYIAHHRRACADHHVSAYRDTLPHRSANTDPRASANGNITCKVRPW